MTQARDRRQRRGREATGTGFRLALLASLLLPAWTAAGAPPTRLEQILEATRPLRHPRGDRLPLFITAVQCRDLPEDEAALERAVAALDARGIAVCAAWQMGAERDASLERGLRLGRIQRKLGLPVAVNATAPTYAICDGSPETAHLDDAGRPFFDPSSASYRNLGCPFRLEQRLAPVREQVDFFCRGYAEAGLDIGFVWADWEIDGPIEWNGGWDAARRCTVCRHTIADVDDFRGCQQAYRGVRSRIERTCYAGVVLGRFPRALVGNYGVYPNDGWRYWYDYFEQEPAAGVPVRRDRQARYRPWVDEFTPSGYTYALPVLYNRYRTWRWYDWDDADFRWCYPLLLTIGNAGRHTPADVPIISFVHWETVDVPGKDADPAVVQMRVEAYREMLWHALLRGHDGFFVWGDDVAREIVPVHEVWSAALEFRPFLDRGTPVSFAVPDGPGPVVSGLRLDDRVLVRRTDFGAAAPAAVRLAVGERFVEVSPAAGACRVLPLEPAPPPAR